MNQPLQFQSARAQRISRFQHRQHDALNLCAAVSVGVFLHAGRMA